MDAQKMTNAIIETLFNEFQNMGTATDSIGQKLDIVASIISLFYLKIELDRLASGKGKPNVPVPAGPYFTSGANPQLY